MAISTTERQRKYRESRNKAAEGRIASYVSMESITALARLARHNECSKRDVLESLIRDADDEVAQSLGMDSPERDKYYSSGK